MVIEVLYETNVKFVLVSISVTATMYFLIMPFCFSNSGGCQEMEIVEASTPNSKRLRGEPVGAVEKQQVP